MSSLLPEELETRIRALREQERLLEDELAALRNEPTSEPGLNHDTATTEFRRERFLAPCSSRQS